MAREPKKQDFGLISTDPTAPTGATQQQRPGPQPQRESEEKKAIGVYLTSQEWAELEAIAAEGGMKRGAMLSFAVRFFLRAYKRGMVETGTKKDFRLP